MNDRGKTEFETMDLGLDGSISQKCLDSSNIECKALDESVVVKETGKEHYANRFQTAVPGKNNINNLEKIKDTSMYNDAFKKYNRLHSGIDIEDDVQKGKQAWDNRADKKINQLAKDMRNKLKGRNSDLENFKANKLISDANAMRAEKKAALTTAQVPNPRPLTDVEKYEKALHVQGQKKLMDVAKKKILENKRSLFKVIKEFGVTGEFLNKMFEE